MSSQNLKILWLVSLHAISVGCFSRCTRSDHTLNNFFRTPSCTPKSFLSALLWLSTALNVHAQSTDLTGIAHVALRVNDLQKSREFYHKLGFEQAFDFVDNGKTSVAYVKVNDRQFIELIPRTSDSQPGGILHTCFEVADIESLHKAYLERGLQPTEPKKARAGNLLFVMHGPDDQLLEYTQYMPGSLHSLDRGKHIGDRISTHMLEATTPVRDLAGERAYYTDKLAFKSTASDGNEMLAAGSSGDKVELEVGPPDAKPRVVFTVANVRDAAHDLRKRGFKVQKSHHAVSVTDPDGAVIVFVASAPGTKL
jgi:catechol 2,3-dioxygenase-like lactoylglutathione lyase family enzyme